MLIVTEKRKLLIVKCKNKTQSTCRPLCVIDFKIVLNAFTLIATSSKCIAKTKNAKLPITENKK